MSTPFRPPTSWPSPAAPARSNSSHRLTTPVLVAIIVAGLAVAGIIGAVIGSSSSTSSAQTPPFTVPPTGAPSPVTVPKGTVPGTLPAVPKTGTTLVPLTVATSIATPPTIAVTTMPGAPVVVAPTVAPPAPTAAPVPATVSPGPAPTIAPPPTAAPPAVTIGTGPPPVTITKTPGPSPTAAPGPSPTVAPGPSPTVAPGPSPTTPAASGEVPVGSGVVLAVPAGWSVQNQQDGDLFIVSDHGDVEVALAKVGSQVQATDLITNLQQNYLTKWLQSPQFDQPAAQQAPSNDIISFATAGFSGAVAGNQGSAALEGLIIAGVRQDGLAFSMIAEWPKGGFNAIQNELGAMLGSVLKSF